MAKEWENMNPNSEHQIWSHWVFHIYEAGKPIPLNEVHYNAAKWLKSGFGSVGQARVQKTMMGYRIEARVEGVPAHDPSYVDSVKKEFRRFVDQGWGPLSPCDVVVKMLSGDRQDGKPSDQLIVIPSIEGD